LQERVEEEEEKGGDLLLDTDITSAPSPTLPPQNQPPKVANLLDDLLGKCSHSYVSICLSTHLPRVLF
jgi:hypothetical protein